MPLVATLWWWFMISVAYICQVWAPYSQNVSIGQQVRNYGSSVLLVLCAEKYAWLTNFSHHRAKSVDTILIKFHHHAIETWCTKEIILGDFNISEIDSYLWVLSRIANFHKSIITWWRHQMETFSALLAICAGNSPVPGEFPTQRPVTRSFDVYFDLRPNKRLCKQLWDWWFQTQSWSLWRHCNEVIICSVQCGMKLLIHVHFNHCTVEVWEWTSNFLSYVIMGVTIDPVKQC